MIIWLVLRWIGILGTQYLDPHCNSLMCTWTDFDNHGSEKPRLVQFFDCQLISRHSSLVNNWMGLESQAKMPRISTLRIIKFCLNSLDRFQVRKYFLTQNNLALTTFFTWSTAAPASTRNLAASSSESRAQRWSNVLPSWSQIYKKKFIER